MHGALIPSDAIFVKGAKVAATSECSYVWGEIYGRRMQLLLMHALPGVYVCATCPQECENSACRPYKGELNIGTGSASDDYLFHARQRSTASEQVTLHGHR